MKVIKQVVPLLLLVSCLVISGCGGNKSVAGMSTTSLGLELIDLEKAYKVGALTEDEYEDAKDALIDRYE